MKNTYASLSVVCMLAFSACPAPTAAQGASVTRSVDSADLQQRMLYRRAVDAVVWGMPAVNYRLMYEEMVGKAGGDFNQIVWWSGLLDWKNQTLTPNPDVIYLMPFFNTKDAGPMVL